MRIIDSDTDVAEGAAWLAAREPRFAYALPQVAPLPTVEIRDYVVTELTLKIVSGARA